MADLGRLSTQYQRASRAASVIDQAVEELHAQPIGELENHSVELGRYMATLAGLVDPDLANEIDPEYLNNIPNALVADLGARSRSDSELSQRLLQTAQDLKAAHKLKEDQVGLIEEVADVANRGALAISQEILTS